jgi:hypothetical protein
MRFSMRRACPVALLGLVMLLAIGCQQQSSSDAGIQTKQVTVTVTGMT